MLKKKTSVANFGNKKDKQDNFMIKASDDIIKYNFAKPSEKDTFSLIVISFY